MQINKRWKRRSFSVRFSLTLIRNSHLQQLLTGDGFSFLFDLTLSFLKTIHEKWSKVHVKLKMNLVTTTYHCKQFPYSELFWFVSSRIRTEYGPE